MNILRKSLLFFCVCISPALAQRQHLSLKVGPPPRPREVVVAAPGPNMVWVPGHYVYNDQTVAYVWVPGVWQTPPASRKAWGRPRYVRHADHYDYYEGNWHDNGKHKGWYKQKNRGKGHGEDK